MPDLVLIDGGRGQLGAAHKELKQLGLKLQCASLAKVRARLCASKSLSDNNVAQ